MNNKYFYSLWIASVANLDFPTKAGLSADEQKAELTIADAVDAEIRGSGYMMLNLTTDSTWFGLTYAADVEHAKLTLINSVQNGTYTDPLWK